MLFLPEMKETKQYQTNQILRQTPEYLQQEEEIFFHIIFFC